MTPRRILVIKSRHLGDVLLTGPLLSTLKTRFPEALVTVLVKSATVSMLAGHPHVHDILTFPERRQGESLWVFLWRYARWWQALWRRHFDWTLNTTDGDRGMIVGFLSGASWRTGFLKSGQERWWRTWLLSHAAQQRPGRRHVVVRNLDLLGLHGLLPPHYAEVHTLFSAQDLQVVEGCLRAQGWDGLSPLVQLHPVARWRFKCWTAEGMAQVVDYLQEKGFAVGITSSADEVELRQVAQILSLCHTRPLDLSGRLSIKQVAAFSSLCRFYFGVDTAMMHMAASLNIPVIALFGPSMPFEWGPWPNGWSGDEATPYPEPNGIQYQGDHVIIQKDWPCVPCNRDGCQGSKISDCLQKLESHEVMAVLDRYAKR